MMATSPLATGGSGGGAHRISSGRFSQAWKAVNSLIVGGLLNFGPKGIFSPFVVPNYRRLNATKKGAVRTAPATPTKGH